MKHQRTCELCTHAAAVYCHSDAAFLCWSCDAAVHGANFLVARHFRRVACASCRSLHDAAPLVSGAGSPRSLRLPLCRSCAQEQPEPEAEAEVGPCPPSPTASASSSSCLSTSDSAAPSRKAAAGRPAPPGRLHARLDGRAASVLIWWCRRMELRSGAQCAAAAARAIAACGAAAASLPPRVTLAASLWSAIKLCEEGAGGAVLLRRLEACSGVPARLIAVAESRIARSAGRVRVRLLEEGWAECA